MYCAVLKAVEMALIGLYRTFNIRSKEVILKCITCNENTNKITFTLRVVTVHKGYN